MVIVLSQVIAEAAGFETRLILLGQETKRELRVPTVLPREFCDQVNNLFAASPLCLLTSVVPPPPCTPLLIQLPHGEASSKAIRPLNPDVRDLLNSLVLVIWEPIIRNPLPLVGLQAVIPIFLCQKGPLVCLC